MKSFEEELQHLRESSTTPFDEIDEQAYKKVFDALGQEPEYALPSNFADRMVRLVEAKEHSKEISRDNFWIGLGIFAFLVGLVFAIAATDFKFSTGAFRFLSGYPGLIIFGIVFILALQWLDKKIVRRETTV
ncbi:MAG: hypothetical protein JSS79_00760 [Bacteroidetes bacterium]|nr:hypothetical protein [Bacteroidota bacterium]